MFFAAAWKSWFPLIEGAAATLTQRMIALGDVGAGQHVLDIGTGIGEPALTVARIVGPTGRVTAIDPDPEMIAFARERAAAAGISNVTFLVTRAEDLSIATDSIDVTLCRWSLMFVDDAAATLSQVRRLLRPRGRLVAATWLAPERVPVLSLARRVVHAHFGKPPPPQGLQTAFALSDVAALAQIFRRAGFADIEQQTLSLTYGFLSAEDYVRFREDCTGSLFSGVGDVTAEERAQAYRAVATALERFRTPDGMLRIPNETCCTVARRGDD